MQDTTLAQAVANSRAKDVIEYDTGRVGLVFDPDQRFDLSETDIDMHENKIVRVKQKNVGGKGLVTVVTIGPQDD